jgi:hypothetical protein
MHATRAYSTHLRGTKLKKGSRNARPVKGERIIRTLFTYGLT